MKKLIFAVLFCLLMCVHVGAVEYIPYTSPEIKYNVQPAGIVVKFPDGSVTTDSVYCNGRLCVSLDDGLEFLGGECARLENLYRVTVGSKSAFYNTEALSNRPYIFSYNNKLYVSLYELITPCDYEMLVDLNTNSVSVMKYNSAVIVSQPVADSSAAYIRLEDLAADGLKPDGTGKYSVSMVEKLKYTAEYLYLNGQEYYFGWIPVYICPELSYVNDISVYYNLYNAYFIYVLDYMTDHGGTMVLHGYTHQYGSYESGDGYEWGEETPYTETEQQERMILAKQSAEKLGYNSDYFEFPHYDATDDQLLMAENYFNVIYQNYPGISNSDKIYCNNSSGKTVYYIPTPAGYVKYKRDTSVYAGIDNCIENGSVLSLYFHPVIDEDNIFISEYNNVRYWCYESEATLPQILSYIQNLGYSFCSFN